MQTYFCLLFICCFLPALYAEGDGSATTKSVTTDELYIEIENNITDLFTTTAIKTTFAPINFTKAPQTTSAAPTTRTENPIKKVAKTVAKIFQKITSMPATTATPHIATVTSPKPTVKTTKAVAQSATTPYPTSTTTTETSTSTPASTSTPTTTTTLLSSTKKMTQSAATTTPTSAAPATSTNPAFESSTTNNSLVWQNLIHFPMNLKAVAADAVIFNQKVKVRQCSCNEIDGCKLSALSQIDDCKTQCSPHLTTFGNMTENMTECFEHFDDELEAFEGCLRSKSEFKCLNESALLYIDVQNYSSVSWNETLDESLADKLKGSVYMKKARKYFLHFRAFQKCVAGCMKQNVVQCYNITRCTVPFPPADVLNQIFHGCSEMKVYEHFNEACRCLANKHSKKLQGICPYVLNRHFMHML